MKIYMYIGIFSDDPDPDIAGFEDEQECYDYIKEEIDRYVEEYGCDKNDIVIENGYRHLVTPQGHEITFIFREMDVNMKDKDNG